MSRRRWVAAAIGLALVAVAVWQLVGAAGGLEVVTVRNTRPPVTLVAPAGVDLASRPLVLIGHGFAGSGVIMRGFAYTLARAGYVTVLWDFRGHGTNPEPLPASMEGTELLMDAEAALAEAQARGWGDPNRTAILGHSMGSGVALAFGREHAETEATIAVSPVSQTVTLDLPHNLLLMAGTLEARFLRNAEALLSEAGGTGGNPAAGTARQLTPIPNVEHLSILFSHRAHDTARQWLDATFGPQPGAAPYTDRRIVWYGLGLLGTLLIATGLRRLVAGAPQPQPKPVRSLARRLAAVGAGAAGATLILWLAGMAGLRVGDLLGLLVGGYLMLWFGVAGVISLLVLWVRPSRPSQRAVLGGLIALAALWLGVGLLGGSVWLPWWLIPRRLVLWPLGAVLLLPWNLAVGEAVRASGRLARVGWWLAASLAVVGGLVLALTLTPELGFLVLILPLFPIILGLHALVAGPYRASWAFALSGALFTSWLLLAVFPLR
jgi:alpha-beta hydrolase superfamily lysophospholipase